MRENTSKFLNIIGYDEHAQQTGENLINEFRQNFEAGFGVLPDKVNQVLEKIGEAIKNGDRINAMREQVAAVYEEMFTSEDIDSMLAFYATPMGRYFALGPKLQQRVATILNESTTEATKTVEPDIARLLGEAELEEKAKQEERLKAMGGDRPFSPFRSYVEGRVAGTPSESPPETAPNNPPGNDPPAAA